MRCRLLPHAESIPTWRSHSARSFLVMSGVPSTGPHHFTQMCMVLCGWVVSLLVAWIHTGPAVLLHSSTPVILHHTCLWLRLGHVLRPRKGVQLPRPAPPRLTKGVHLVRRVDPSPPFLPRSKRVQLRTWVWMEVIHNASVGISCATTCRKHVKASQQRCKARA